MDYAKLSERIKQHIARNPSDHVPYMDLLSVCRQLEPDDFTLAHELSKDLRKLSSAALHKCSANAADSLFDVYKKAMCFDAPHDFDTFLLYIEMNRNLILYFSLCNIQVSCNNHLNFYLYQFVPHKSTFLLCLI